MRILLLEVKLYVNLNRGEMVLKKMTSSILSGLVAISLLTAPTVSFASSGSETEAELLKQPADGISIITTNPEPDGTLAKGVAAATVPFYRGQSKVYAIGGVSSFSDVFTDSSQATPMSIDRVYVKSKQYVDGYYANFAIDDRKRASHAGIYVKYGARPTGNQEVLGEHKFEQTGFKVVTLETTDT